MLEEIFDSKQITEQVIRDAKTYLGKYDEDWIRCRDMWDRNKKHDTRYVGINEPCGKFFVTGLAIKENDLGGHDIVDVKREYSLSEVLAQFKDIMAKDGIAIESETYISNYIEKNESAREFLVDVYGVISNMTDITKECTVDVAVDMGYQSYRTVFQMRKPRTAENGLVFDELSIEESLTIWCEHFGSVERITQPYEYCRKQIKRMSEYILPYKGGFEALFPDEESKKVYMDGLRSALLKENRE